MKNKQLGYAAKNKFTSLIYTKFNELNEGMTTEEKIAWEWDHKVEAWKYGINNLPAFKKCDKSNISFRWSQITFDNVTIDINDEDAFRPFNIFMLVEE